MEKILKALNKKMVAEATGISYTRIQNIASSKVQATREEEFKIKSYIKSLIA